MCANRSREGFSPFKPLFFLLLTTMLVAPVAHGDNLDSEIDQLRSEVAELSQALFALEADILHPADTQLAVFLTLESRNALELDSVEFFINGHPAASHLYTPRERVSLAQGGVQRLYIGNLPNGQHTLKASLTAQAANDRYVRREASFRFQKRPGESRVQLKLDAKAPDYEPTITFREWQ